MSMTDSASIIDQLRSADTRQEQEHLIGQHMVSVLAEDPYVAREGRPLHEHLGLPSEDEGIVIREIVESSLRVFTEERSLTQNPDGTLQPPRRINPMIPPTRGKKKFRRK